MPKNAIEGYMWTKLAAKQGSAKARSNLPAMVREMTEKELKKARYKVSRFRAKETRTEDDRRRVPRDAARERYRSGRSGGGGRTSARPW